MRVVLNVVLVVVVVSYCSVLMGWHAAQVSQDTLKEAQSRFGYAVTACCGTMPLSWHVVPGLAFLQHRDYKHCVEGWTKSRQQVADDAFFYLTSFMLLVFPFIVFFLPRQSGQGNNKRHRVRTFRNNNNNNKRVVSSFPYSDGKRFSSLISIFKFLGAHWFGSYASSSTESLFRCDDVDFSPMDTSCLDTTSAHHCISLLSRSRKGTDRRAPEKEFDVLASPEPQSA
ncbi:hypothetical protein Pcinc_038992 [Petrolisthes cinctipes]|uniref:Uncharacterized protein n=1 Tax=Petrolisthes cinctipes TaxID=88211 RepID=A0AAE1BQB3_PETCI|nr:hypothetical protein Pcinc_038992 [Petrolisthes cinctipes]